MNSPEDNSDWAARVARVLVGDENAVLEMSDALDVLAYKYNRRAGLPHHDAEDLAQEFVVRVITHLHQFDGRNFIGWAFKILGRQLAGHYRDRKRQVPTMPLLESDWEVSTSGPTQNGLLSEAEHSALEDAILKMREESRQIVESQTGFQKLSFKEMACELGISEGNARLRYHRAKKELETTLRQDPRMKAWIASHSAH